MYEFPTRLRTLITYWRFIVAKHQINTNAINEYSPLFDAIVVVDDIVVFPTSPNVSILFLSLCCSESLREIVVFGLYMSALHLRICSTNSDKSINRENGAERRGKKQQKRRHLQQVQGKKPQSTCTTL